MFGEILKNLAGAYIYEKVDPATRDILLEATERVEDFIDKLKNK